MSLKAFHIFFIAVSIVLSFGFGIWLIAADAVDGSATVFATAAASFVAGIGLILYAIRFLRKLRHVSYL